MNYSMDIALQENANFDFRSYFHSHCIWCWQFETNHAALAASWCLSHEQTMPQPYWWVKQLFSCKLGSGNQRMLICGSSEHEWHVHMVNLGEIAARKTSRYGVDKFEWAKKEGAEIQTRLGYTYVFTTDRTVVFVLVLHTIMTFEHGDRYALQKKGNG